MSHLTFTWAPKGNSTAGALALAAAIMLFPANMLPVLDTANAGRNRSDTILSGAVELWHSGLSPISIIVFTASIVIPVLKLVGLAWLIFATRRGMPKNPRRLTRIYAALDFIGRWSMLDVFLAAFLTGLVEFGELASVRANSGIVAFASAVVLTVFATQAFDPRSIWLKASPSASPNPYEHSFQPQSFPRPLHSADLGCPHRRCTDRRLDGGTRAAQPRARNSDRLF